MHRYIGILVFRGCIKGTSLTSYLSSPSEAYLIISPTPPHYAYKVMFQCYSLSNYYWYCVGHFIISVLTIISMFMLNLGQVYFEQV